MSPITNLNMFMQAIELHIITPDNVITWNLTNDHSDITKILNNRTLLNYRNN